MSCDIDFGFKLLPWILQDTLKTWKLFKSCNHSLRNIHTQKHDDWLVVEQSIIAQWQLPWIANSPRGDSCFSSASHPFTAGQNNMNGNARVHSKTDYLLVTLKSQQILLPSMHCKNIALYQVHRPYPIWLYLPGLAYRWNFTDSSAILQAEGFLLYLYWPLILTLLRV